MQAETNYTHQWLRSGDEIFPALLAAIETARQSICLEIYIFTPGPLGNSFRAALGRARARGVQVRVLLDALGSVSLPADYWRSLRQAGAEVRQFNPVALKRLWIRNHRKLLVCDDRVAVVGGFNLAPEYEGDGLHRGWCDVGLKIEGPLAAQLAASFTGLFERADFDHKPFVRLRKSADKKAVEWPNAQILLNGPGRGPGPFQSLLQQDLARAARVQIMASYFLPPRPLRRELLRVVRRGGRVQLILPGRSDVQLSKLATQSLYQRFLKRHVEIHEYQPQILHAKLLIVNDTVYLGSSNLDPRSLRINYELMLRFENAAMAAEARQIFADSLLHTRPVTAKAWHRSQTFWGRLKQRWAYFLLTKIDPYLARRQWRALPK
jgi:cardiolipin synthase